MAPTLALALWHWWHWHRHRHRHWHWHSQRHWYRQIASLQQHKSQYSNMTAVADSVKELGTYVAKQTPVGAGGYVEGFTPVLELP